MRCGYLILQYLIHKVIHLDQDFHMADKVKIAILLASYNGEKFISEQIDSLFSQTVQDFKIYVRDDGSSDSTIEIIHHYEQKYPDRISMIQDETLHRGARDSFMWLLQNVEAEYYMFCDQDDVWLPFKIEHTFDKLKKLECLHPHKAIMVHTDLRIVDAALNTIHPSFWNWGKFNVDLNRKFCYAALGNAFTGCTMMFNALTKNFVFPINENVKLHDEWIGLAVVKNGVVDNLKEQTILYRQHGNNVCSAGGRRSLTFLNIFRSIC